MDDSEHSLAAEYKAPTINRAVMKPASKKRAAPAKKAAPKSRAALKDRTNLNDPEIEEDAPPKKKAKKTATVVVDETEEDIKPSPVAKKAKVVAPRSKPATKKRAPSPEACIPETQQEVEESATVEETPASPVAEAVLAPREESVTVDHTAATRRTRPYNAPVRARSTSVQMRSYSREGSAALAERRVTDTETRRKLADMTSKYEDMRLRYESLSELGTRSAESNFEKLKRATDQRAKDASDLIASLKKELSEAKKAASQTNSDTAKLQTQLAASETARETAAASLTEVQSALTTAQNEIKALTAKLEAAREAARKAAAVEQKVTGSAVKASRGNLDSAKQAALKEELYRDLTGLIINSVKRRDGEDEYNCIQTGRNGTLQFHLSVSNDASVTNPKTPSGTSYEDAEFAYEPFFDQDRDRDLINLLPDYLTEEICFPREHAVRFFSKIMDSMTKAVVIDEQ